ncbi:hypothetical protein HHK36_022274 [Tetracentron sinense]|uniref:Protein kinase domain-containing protein n=1 Tax=Tetracentron sinense TaxID=13715 RepID=A0A834YMQ7_TETSI|nr:hypothetical protein HHK36_022274 [Tetracentron sinense]
MWSCFRIPEQREEERHFSENGALVLEELVTSFDGRSNPIRSFSKQELERATNNYHQDGVLHQDLTYKLYKGSYEDRPISVKKFTADAPETYIGCGCLSDYIFEKELSPSKKNQLLSWESKLRIATEIADAVAYLHKGTSKPIIHRLINSKTIFLDQHYVAKLFEFGLSISIPLGETQVHEDVVVGYFGYIALESIHTGRFTEKSDVYSFGVVLFEILTGKRVNDILMELYGVANNHFFIFHNNEKDIRLYLNANIVKGNTEQLMACAELTMRCIKMNSEERPSMMEVAKELRRIRKFQHDSL